MNSDAIEILLVEDNPDDVELALYDFKKNKLANPIQVLRDGEEALDFLFCRGAYADRKSKSSPPVVLLDLKLPKMDGLEVLRAIRADPRTQPVPVVIMTSSQHQREMVEGYQLGVNSYIQKPLDSDQFREVMRQLGFCWLVVHQSPTEELCDGASH